MSALRHRDTLVGWIFAAAGYGLIRFHEQMVEDLLHLRAYSLALFANHLAAQYFFMGFGILALLPAAGLLVVTGWGVGHQRTWARWTGLMPCLYLLLGFPYLTVLGLVGLLFLWTQKTAESQPLGGKEYWNRRRRSGWMITASILGWVIALAGFDALRLQAFHAGLPWEYGEHPGLLAMLLLAWLHVGLHEAGHAAAAMLVGHQVRVLCIGPVAVSKESGRYRVRFEWRGLLLLGGYMGAVPTSARRFREKQIAVVAAGPSMSVLTGTLLLTLSSAMPGSQYAQSWNVVAMGAVIGLYIGVVNLLPLGYCDGTILYHLFFRTRRGEELTALILRGSCEAPTDVTRDYDAEVAAQRARLKQVLDTAGSTPSHAGAQYIALGGVEYSSGLPRAAEADIAEGLTRIPQGDCPASEAPGWAYLQSLRISRFDWAGGAEAYQKGLLAADRFARDLGAPRNKLHAALITAGLHTSQQNWDQALDEICAALPLCGDFEEGRLWRATFLQLQAKALVQLGRVDEGLDAANEVATICRAQTTGTFAPNNLGRLGIGLWEAGQAEKARSLLIEAIPQSETRGDIRLSIVLRFHLAQILRFTGHPAHAGCVLPPAERIWPEALATYHVSRGTIYRAAGKRTESIADFRRAVQLTVHDIPLDEVTLALERALLAAALAETGKFDEAETQALQAHEAMTAAGHPDFGPLCITLAVIGWRKRGSTGGYVEAALRGWQDSPLPLPAEKARELEEAAQMLEAAELPAEAERCRTEALRYTQRQAIRAVVGAM